MTNELPSNSFLAVLQRKETQVGTLTAASNCLADCVRAANATGKKATVTVTLTVEPKQGALHFGASVKHSLPREQEPLCIFYADDTGQLHRDDPRQKELSFTSHEGGLAAPEPAERTATA